MEQGAFKKTAHKPSQGPAEDGQPRFTLAKWMTSFATLLYGVKPIDPATFALIAVLPLAVRACWLPARRASKVDLLVALRHD